METESFFGGTAYLGIPYNEEFKQLVFEGINRYGTNFGASRNNNVTLDIFSIAENEAAIRSNAGDSIIVSSGFLSAQLVIQHFIGKYKFIYAPDTHPALWLGKPQPPEMSFKQWANYAIGEVNNSDKPVLLITNSLNNLVPEIYDFGWLNKIDSAREFYLVVDDSHGLGITGAKGEGVYERIPKLPNVSTIVIASLAKAMGIDAGVILSTKYIIDDLRKSPVYAGASPPSPGFLYAYANACSVYLEELNKLRFNMNFLNSFFEGRIGISFLKDFPVYLLDDELAAERLASKGIKISSFAYPDPKGKTLNRIVLNSRHSKEEMGRLVENILKQE